jgi:uncharacterized glyoxalase superfamily protein PhnB
MPERSPMERLEALLSDLPRAEFRARLRFDMAKEAQMPTTTTLPTVVPYIAVLQAEEVGAFIQQAFGAQGGVLGHGSEGGLHGQYVIGDAIVMIGGGPSWRNPKPRMAALHVYVDDADAAYRRAMEAGGKSLYEPSDKPYGDREAAVEDVAGNQWFIGTPRGRTLPAGSRNLNVTFLVHGSVDFLDFLGRAFAAEVVERHPPEGPVLHAGVRIGDCIVEIGEAHGQWQPIPTGIFLTVDDCDSAYERAVKAGGEAVMPPTDRPFGRTATVGDAAGNWWYITGPLPKKAR